MIRLLLIMAASSSLLPKRTVLRCWVTTVVPLVVVLVVLVPWVLMDADKNTWLCVTYVVCA